MKAKNSACLKLKMSEKNGGRKANNRGMTYLGHRPSTGRVSTHLKRHCRFLARKDYRHLGWSSCTYCLWCRVWTRYRRWPHVCRQSLSQRYTRSYLGSSCRRSSCNWLKEHCSMSYNWQRNWWRRPRPEGRRRTSLPMRTVVRRRLKIAAFEAAIVVSWSEGRLAQVSAYPLWSFKGAQRCTNLESDHHLLGSFGQTFSL